MWYRWFLEGYNPGAVDQPAEPTRQVARKRRKSRFEVLVQFLVPAGLLAWGYRNLFLALPVDTWLVLLGVGLGYLLLSFALYPVEQSARHNLPGSLLRHPFRLAKTERGIRRVLTLLMTPGWLMSKPLIRFVTLLRYAAVRGNEADQLYYSPNLSVDPRWALPGLVLVGLSCTPIGDVQLPSSKNDLGFVMAYAGGFSLIFGLRAKNAFVEVCHKIIATVWAVLPTIFLALSIIILVVMTTTKLFVSGNIAFPGVVYDAGKQMLHIMILACVTFGTWTLTRHLVYEKYNCEPGESDAYIVTLALLFFFGGMFGLHRFYTGRVFTGVLYICTMGLFGAGLIYDGILLITGSFDT